jgi:hypothetical protein
LGFIKFKLVCVNVLGMIQFISSSAQLRKSVKSVLVFATYDGGESKPYLQKLSEVFQMTNDVTFKYKDNDVKVFFSQKQVGESTILFIYVHIDIFLLLILSYSHSTYLT